ncbi:MAG: DUF4249 family protein [Bacteroidales bacterium]|nr:DUF4249 family protein [Bacteroidales bacterium]MDD3914756.1 DUF4249 family protein [Bacteroidales bacterium]
MKNKINRAISRRLFSSGGVIVSSILIISVLMMFIITSCSQEIAIDTGEYTKRPVIEGYIENGSSPWVCLTYNQAFFTEINLDFTTPEGMSLLTELFITDATVFVSDGSTVDTLQFMIDPAILEGNYVWPPVKYQGNKIVGQVGGTYNLTVIIDDETYTAYTTITTPVIPDSIWLEYDKANEKYCWIHAMIQDNAATADYYNCFAKRLGRDNYFSECSNCLWDDTYFNGMAFEAIAYRGSSSLFSMDTVNAADDKFGAFTVGDTVQLKVVTMDEESFRFWQSLLNSSVVHSNIDGDAIGVWCGYGAYYTEPVICVEKP